MSTKAVLDDLWNLAIGMNERAARVYRETLPTLATPDPPYEFAGDDEVEPAPAGIAPSTEDGS